MLKLLVLTLSLLAFAFALPAERGKRDTGENCTIDGENFPSGTNLTIFENDRCVLHQCIEGSATQIATGCAVQQNVCLITGQSITSKCIKYECSFLNFLPMLTIINVGCEDNGVCRSENYKLTKDCGVYECNFRGTWDYVPEATTGCNDNGTCRDLGSVWNDEDCKFYRCQLAIDTTSIQLTSQGCRSSDGKCRKTGQWFPRLGVNENQLTNCS